MAIVESQDVVQISCDFCDMSFYVDEENQEAVKVCPYCEVFLESGLADPINPDDEDDDESLIDEFDIFDDDN